VKKRITFERKYPAAVEEVWSLWTTKEGLESWWGPEGFTIVVHKLDLRPGGVLEYDMIASAPAQVEFMKRAGMPLTTPARVTYTEVVHHRRLGFTHLVDFVPGVAPYDVVTEVDFDPSPAGTRMIVTIDAMHDDQWTQNASMGWESQLRKLEAALQS
jgi:uncharacterized protein YndB with AHSA1/START domain